MRICADDPEHPGIPSDVRQNTGVARQVRAPTYERNWRI
jgi:hypothetical protein